jgi:NADH:ubiquinone oxidoreductase subunit C
VLIAREGLAAVAQWLRDDPAAKCEFLMDLTCVDYLKFGQALSSAPRLATPSPLPYFMDAKPDPNPWKRGVSDDEYRFELVYNVYSLTHNHRLRVKVPRRSVRSIVDAPVALGGLVRAGSLGYVRDSISRTPESEAHSHV